MNDAQRLAIDQRLYGTCYAEAGTGRRIDPATVGHPAMPSELQALGESFAADVQALAVNGAIKRMAAIVARAEAVKSEGMAKAAIRQRFPRTGRWLADHPRALKLLFRLRPGLRPTMVYEIGKHGAQEVRWP